MGGRAVALLARHSRPLCAEPAYLELGAGQYRHYARRRSGCFGVNRAYDRMGERRAQHVSACLTRQIYVVGEAPLAHQQPRILFARHRLADSVETHCLFLFLEGILSRSANCLGMAKRRQVYCVDVAGIGVGTDFFHLLRGAAAIAIVT